MSTIRPQRVFVGVISIIFVLVTLVSKNSNTYQLNKPHVFQGKFQLPFMMQSTPTPLPFVELTIPYLRQRNYESKLGPLQKISENVDFTSFITNYDSDGLKVNGLLTIPNGDPSKDSENLPQVNSEPFDSVQSKKWPAIVIIHGYIPPQNYQTLTRYLDHVNFLARNGFVVFKIDLRGHGNSEGEAGGGYYSSDYVIDGLNARAALANSDFVSPNKIGFWGHSMAGNVVMRILAARPDIPAVVIWAGAGYTYQDLREIGIDDNSYQPPSSDSERQRKRRELFASHGQFDPNSQFWKQVVPTNYLSEIKGAIQLDHAIDDTVVSIDYSRNLNKILDSTSITHELNELSSGGHNITGSSFTTAMQKTVEFFKLHLK